MFSGQTLYFLSHHKIIHSMKNYEKNRLVWIENISEAKSTSTWSMFIFFRNTQKCTWYTVGRLSVGARARTKGNDHGDLIDKCINFKNNQELGKMEGKITQSRKTYRKYIFSLGDSFYFMFLDYESPQDSSVAFTWTRTSLASCHLEHSHSLILSLCIMHSLNSDINNGSKKAEGRGCWHWRGNLIMLNN